MRIKQELEALILEGQAVAIQVQTMNCANQERIINNEALAYCADEFELCRMETLEIADKIRGLTE